MQNYLQAGTKIVVAAPYAVASGEGALVGSLFGVAEGDAALAANVVLVTEGVVEIKKLAAQAWTVGAPIYWDNTAKQATTVSTANTLIGVAVAAAANPSASGQVRLNGSFG